MDSDSEDERVHGYTPILAEKLTGRAGSGRPESASNWMKDGVSLYTNELFHDEDAQDAGAAPAPSASLQSPGATMRKGPSLAAKRQERLAGGSAYAPNSLLKSQSQRAPASPTAAGGIGRYPADPAVPSPLRPSGAGAAAAQGLASPTGGVNGHGLVHGLAASYDPNDDDDDGDGVGALHPAASGRYQYQTHGSASLRGAAGQHGQHAQAALQPPVPQYDLSNLRVFLQQPGPKTQPIQCYIVRDKGSARMYPRYMLFLEDGKRFLMAARKRKKQTTSNYIISLDMDNLSRETAHFFGKVRANFVGTEFTVFDAGSKASGSGSNDGGARQELGAVTYQYNVLGTRGPRKMMAAIPALDSSGRNLYRCQGEFDSILERIRNRRGLEELVVMGNKPPRWNDELNAYCLNFNGRVTEASVKNFQLVSDDNQNHVILQFGKVGKNTFTMDYQWPMSALQAFAICISSFDNKLACE